MKQSIAVTIYYRSTFFKLDEDNFGRWSDSVGIKTPIGLICFRFSLNLESSNLSLSKIAKFGEFMAALLCKRVISCSSSFFSLKLFTDPLP